MIQCKLCGTILKDEAHMRDHRLNQHDWYTGDSILKEGKKFGSQ